MLTGAGRRTSGKTDPWAFELRPTLRGFCAIPTHLKAFSADGDAIVSDCKVVFINRWTTALSVQVNKWLNTMITAVFIVSHGVMSRIQKELGDMGLRKELLHGEVVIQKSM